MKTPFCLNCSCLGKISGIISLMLVALIQSSCGKSSSKDYVNGLVEDLANRDSNKRSLALGFFGRLRGREAKRALPYLKIALNDRSPYVRYRVAEAIWRSNPTETKTLVVPVLLELLKGVNEGDAHLAKRCSAKLIWDIGAAAKEAAPILLKWKKNKSVTDRLLAACALNQIDSSEKNFAIRESFRALGSKDSITRILALQVLGKVGSDGPATTARIREMMNDPDQLIRDAAANALKSINGEKK